MLGCDRGINRERIDEVVKQVGLEHRIQEKVKRYSLGMRQRLGLAQALLHKPSLLILDEPTNGLDPAGIREFREHLRKLAREEGVAVLVSSHLLSEMELMCDRIAIIQNGKLIGVQTVNEFVQEEAGNAKVTVQFVAEPREKAFKLLKQQFPTDTQWAEGNAIEVNLGRGTDSGTSGCLGCRRYKNIRRQYRRENPGREILRSDRGESNCLKC